jgi:imidazolonepropionase
MKLIGPFSQILTLAHIDFKGSISDQALEVVKNGGVLVSNGHILEVGNFDALRRENPLVEIEEIAHKSVLLPGFVDCHTHTCFAGSRAMDFAERNAGTSYLEIAEKGGGIWSTVSQTRNAIDEDLVTLTENRVNNFLKKGITTEQIRTERNSNEKTRSEKKSNEQNRRPTGQWVY